MPKTNACCLGSDGSDWITVAEIHATNNTFRLISQADGNSLTGIPTIQQIQKGGVVSATATGSSNAYVVALAPAPGSYAQNMRVTMKANHTNTGAATVNVNALGAKAIQKNGQALAANDITSGDMIDLVYDGTAFQMQSPARNSSKVAFPDQGELTISSGAITVTGTSHTIDTESDAASDDLDTINGGTNGSIIIVRAENAARTVVFKDGTGNIKTPDGSDITLDETEKIVVLQYDSALSKWVILSAPGGGGGGGGNAFLGSYTASGDSLVSVGSGLDLDASIDGTYHAYILRGRNVISSTDGANIYVRTSSDGGSTNDSGSSDYKYGGWAIDNSASLSGRWAATAAQILITLDGGVGNAAEEGINFDLILFAPSGTRYTQLSWQSTHITNSAGIAKVDGSAFRISAADVDALAVLASSGNLSGEFYLEGITLS